MMRIGKGSEASWFHRPFKMRTRELPGRISRDGLWRYRTASQCGDLWRYLRRRGKHYNRREARHHGALLIHVQRKRMFTVISTLAHSIAPAAHRLKPLRLHVRTVIYDNGKEFAGHRHFARIQHIQTCFAAAYHAGERGVNENTNGLIRDFFPKGTNFSTNHPARVAKGERLLNSRSGKSLSIRHFKNNARK